MSGRDPNSPEAGVAHRATGLTCWFAGKYCESRYHFERALSLFEPGRDDDLAFRFGPDPGVAAMIDLAIASWPLGEVDYALSLIDRMQTRISHLTNVGTIAFARMHAALFELMRRDKGRAAPHAFELSRLVREHKLAMYSAFSLFFEGWVTAAMRAARVENMRRGSHTSGRAARSVIRWAIEDRAGGGGGSRRRSWPRHRRPRRRVGDADRMGYRAFEAELHRARGEMLLMRDPVDPGPAEEALQTRDRYCARARNPQLRPARGAVARQALPVDRPARRRPRRPRARPRRLSADAGDAGDRRGAGAARGRWRRREEVRADAEQRRRVTRLRVAYGNALFTARGFGAAETMDAFAKARESALGDTDPSDRLAADYGLWAGSYVHGDLSSMRAHVEAFLGDVRARPEFA